MANHEISKVEHAKRLKCNADGMCDEESGIECNISKTSYREWRVKEGLPYNVYKKKKEVHVNRRALTNNDIVHYNHNKIPAPVNNCAELTIIVDHEAVEREFERLGIKSTGNLNKGSIPPTLAGKILGINNSKGLDYKSRRITSTETYSLPRCNAHA